MEPISIRNLVLESGEPLDRVLGHVNFEITTRKRERLV
jgi:hypothetical protein